MSREDPCSSIKYIYCGNDGAGIQSIDMGGRGLKGVLPASMVNFTSMRCHLALLPPLPIITLRRCVISDTSC